MNETTCLMRELDARGVMTLRLNRGAAFNALSEELLDDLTAALYMIAAP